MFFMDINGVCIYNYKLKIKYVENLIITKEVQSVIIDIFVQNVNNILHITPEGK